MVSIGYLNSQIIWYFHIENAGYTTKPSQPKDSIKITTETQVPWLCKWGLMTDMVKHKTKEPVTYFENHKSKMSYARQVQQDLPIGSGITEAARKVLIKQRMCQSGSRWKETAAPAPC
jgi:hypothetical protein